MKYKRYDQLTGLKKESKQPPAVITADQDQRQGYSSLVIGEVWEKGKKEFGFVFFKRDRFGKIIAKHEYGKRTQYGWEIVHQIPLSEGGTDGIENLIPVHWENAQT